MSDVDLEEFMRTSATSHLSESQKEILRKSPDRAHCYNGLKASNDMDTANNKQREFTNFLIENRIFMTADLRKKFGVVESTFISALTKYEIGTMAGAHEMLHSGQMAVSDENLQALVDDVEQAIQARLRYEESLSLFYHRHRASVLRSLPRVLLAPLGGEVILAGRRRRWLPPRWGAGCLSSAEPKMALVTTSFQIEEFP